MVATVDLSDLIPDFKAEFNTPGGNAYPTATNKDYLTQLRNAFWEAVLYGLIKGYTVDDDGIVVPLDETSTTPLGRDIQQIIIYLGGMRILKNTYSTLKTGFKAQAGPVLYETQQSATVIKGLLDQMAQKLDIWLERLSDVGIVPTYVVDGVLTGDASLREGNTWWVNGSELDLGPGYGR